MISETFHKLVIDAENQAIKPSYKYFKRLKISYLKNDWEIDIGDKKLYILIQIIRQ